MKLLLLFPTLLIAQVPSLVGPSGVATTIQSSTANPAATGSIKLASGDTICWRNNANSADICISKSVADVILFPPGGLASNIFFTATANPAQSGIFRLASADQIVWRNNANSADMSLGKNANDFLVYNTPTPSAANGVAGGTLPVCGVYTLSTSGANFTVSINGGTVVNTAIAAAATQNVPLVTIPATGIILGIDIHTTTIFAGTGFTSITLTIGDSAGTTTSYTSSTFQLVAAASNTNFQDTALFKHVTFAGSTVNAALTANQNLNANALTGSVDIRICWVAP